VDARANFEGFHIQDLAKIESRIRSLSLAVLYRNHIFFVAEHDDHHLARLSELKKVVLLVAMSASNACIFARGGRAKLVPWKRFN
jgi:hypothetical protein